MSASILASSIDLTLLISEAEDGRYIVNASSDKQLKKTSLSVDDGDKLIRKAQPLEKPPFNPAEIKELGQQLFQALIRDEVREMYRILEGRVAEGQNFRLILDISPHCLRQLPWECMYDPYWDHFLSRCDNSHILRSVKRKPESLISRTDQGFTKLVIAIANPAGQLHFDSQTESELMDDALKKLRQKELLTLHFIQGSQQRIKDSLQNMPDVFHFVGHGGIENSTPGLYLEDPYGDSIFEDATTLVNDYFTPPPGKERLVRLIILSACQTGKTPQTEGYNSLAHQLASQADAVLAMQYPIGLDNLTEFNKALYLALANGAPLDTAVNAARRSISQDKPGGARDWIAPLLITQSEIMRLPQENPFKGRTYYDTDDKERFFGRKTELRRLAQLYHTQKVSVIRGECGCGKTSLLKAGLTGIVKSEQQPLVYLEVSEDLAKDLRVEINRVLIEDKQLPLPEDEPDQLATYFPHNLAIILDRAEQVELLSEQVDNIVTALIQWALDPAPERRRSRLVIATRLDEQGQEPALLQRLLPDEDEIQRLDLKMLDWDAAIEFIEDTTRTSGILFRLETIHAILNGLHYNHVEKRNMTELQVVCRAVYQRAEELGRTNIEPELISDLGQVEGILEREFDIDKKLKKIVDESGEEVYKVLAQFVGSAKERMRPRSLDELRLRCCIDERQLTQILYQLEDEGWIRRERKPSEVKYELVHESLTRQMDWLEADDFELHKLEELIESTQTLIPLSSDKGGLVDLDKRREELTLSEDQQQLLLFSALEADHQTKYWFERVKKADHAFMVLTSKHLGPAAQERACHYLGKLGAKGAEKEQEARDQLLTWACDIKRPNLSLEACRALASLVDQDFLRQKFSSQVEALLPGEIRALATMHDIHGLPLKELNWATRRQVGMQILKDNSIQLLSSVVKAALLGAAGFGLAGMWIYALNYTDQQALPAFFVLEISLIALLTFILALPGALGAPLGRDLWLLLSGGRRQLSGALGSIVGSALGTGLTIVLLAALAEYSQPSLTRLIRYFLSAMLWGAAICLPWLLSLRRKIKPGWLVLLAGVLGGLVYWGVSLLGNWWPQESFALSLDESYGGGQRIVAGMFVGLASAAGLVWGQLRKRS